MDCEVPEQIVCFKVDACHVVKDISVDEVDLKCSFQPSYLDFTDVSRKSVDSPSLFSGEMKSLVGRYHNMDVSGQCGSKNSSHKSEENIHPKDDITHNEINSLVKQIRDVNVPIQCCSKNQLQKGEANIDAKDEIPHNLSDERVVPENMLLFHSWDKDNCHPDSYQFKVYKGQQNSEQEQLCSVETSLQKNEGKIVANDVAQGVSVDVLPLNVLLLQKPDIENSRPASSNFNGNEDEQQSEQDSSIEPIIAYSAVFSVAEESSVSECADKPPFDTKAERGSITSNFETPTTSSREESPQNAYHQHLRTLPGELEDGTVDSLTTSLRSFFIQDGHGQSNFYAVGPLSGPISYSGPMSHSGPVPNSGSISVRSDSSTTSTTSTRSFAFPIIHSEWNNSPVKMAKADQTHFRKHRGWRMNLLCCRF